ncbi:MAG: helix-turn-helix domain-containing protein [Rhodobacteraceae bacterium]|nr:helix-turn-helix domain-containing protein [Paracoccaceae bacterium]
MPARTKPLRPDQLAERWGCSPETVRNMCAQNMIGHFLIGTGARRHYRIPADAVEEYECQTSQSGASEAGSVSSGTTLESAAAISLRHSRAKRPKQKP